eukprot:1272743-Pyramimonas_sp.AAC.1
MSRYYAYLTQRGCSRERRRASRNRSALAYDAVRPMLARSDATSFLRQSCILRAIWRGLSGVPATPAS